MSHEVSRFSNEQNDIALNRGDGPCALPQKRSKMMHTKGELKTVATFDKLYLHIGTMRIADIPNTGAISEEESIANAQRLVLTWNCHDGLVEALERTNTEIIAALEIPTDKRLEKDRNNLIYVIRDMLTRAYRGQQILKEVLTKAKPQS